ncbi:restriction endonuclease subunit S [Francisella tularensis subsp. novicida FSC159]|uniref:restriction endonuclease subunit S n=1 Tax=Francisella tularensis TaxID=263 RepID=UPI001C0ECA75|nr:restriction endonuclease subunit S [Francisella tularensis]MBK2111281.1 restriction endonuclease subunit S [Francisella tularensis subsp. novicida FSC159]
MSNSELPNGWRESRLDSLIEIKYGKDHKLLDDGDIPVYGSGGVMRYANQALYNKESILIPRKGTLENIFYIDKPFWTVDTIFWSKIDSSKIFGKFLFYKLKTLDLASYNVGSAVPSLTTKILNEIEINIPPLPEQKAIAEVLSSLDDKIDLLHQQNQTLEDMAQTLFREWFIEKADEGWEEVKLGDLLSITSSKRIFYSEYVDNGVPFYRSKEIIELHNTGSTKSELYITEERFNEIVGKFGVPIDGDILLTSVGTLGVPYRVNLNDKFYFKDGNLTWFKDFKIPSIVIYYWLKSDIGKEQLESITIGSTQSALTIRGLKEIRILRPPKLVVESLTAKLNILDEKIQNNQKQIKTLEQTRDTLLPKLMSSKVRVII